MKSLSVVPLAAAVVLALGLTACGGGANSAGDGASGDKPSGQVSLYSPAAAEMATVYQRFNEEHPEITINPVALVGAELGTRLQSEIASGQAVGDIVMTSTTSTAGPWIKEQRDWYAPYIPDSAKKMAPEKVYEDQGWFSPFGSVFGVTYNADAVPEGEVPRTWDDVIDPKWKDRIAMGDPRRPGITSVAFVGLLGNKVVDDTWFAALAKLNVRPVDPPQVSPSLVSGQSDLAIWGLGFTTTAQKQGAPLKFIPELAVEVPYGAALLKNAPNPEAAKVFLDWSASENGQKALADAGYMPTLSDAVVPEGVDAEIDMPSVPPYEENSVLTREVIATWTKLLG